MSLLLLNKQFNIFSSKQVANFYIDQLIFMTHFYKKKIVGWHAAPMVELN